MTILGVRVRYSHRSPAGRGGRFGGGWQWKVGFQASSLSRQRGTIIVSLLVSSVRIEWGVDERPF